jgi:HME family heavy-metal exporter
MTLGGLAIAIGGLVDDAVVDVENIMRRLRLNSEKSADERVGILEVVRSASMEVRTGIIYATMIIVLVFVPLFALSGIEGRLFTPLGIAFIVSTVASLIVSVTITPVLSYYLLPSMSNLAHSDTRLLIWLKANYRKYLEKFLTSPKRFIAYACALVLVSGLSLPFIPTSFLPPFNEGTLLIGLRLNPGVALTESSAIARQAELLVMQVPEVTYVGRRSGRAELDEHAEGVHVSELDVGLKPASEFNRSMADIQADIRKRLINIPAAIAIGQPISHRIDHMLSGVRSQIAIKIFGDDLDVLRSQADLLRAKLSGIAGMADLEIEKQVLAPQIKIRINYDIASQYGVSTSQVMELLQSMIEGEKVSQIIEGNKRFSLVMKLPDSARTMEGLSDILIDTPTGRIPLSRIASIEDSDGPNQISRDDGKRRIVLSANTSNRALSEVVKDIRMVVGEQKLPEGYFITLGGQFVAQEKASKLIGFLSLGSLLLMFAVLYSKYQSVRLSLMIMSNIPLAMIGAIIGLWISGQPLSIAALVGFITLAGVSVRNGILKISHYLNLMKLEGEAFSREMIMRGSMERLAPVLMTALVTAFALAPLLFEAERPGTEVLHPVAVVIFFGLISSTLLDTFLTPAMFWLYGKQDAEKSLNNVNIEGGY